MRAYLADNLVYFVVGATIFLIVLLLVLLFPKKKPDLAEEYDYMRTPEAVPSQLDLARAYIAMEDFIAAKATLNEVIKRGNVDQQQQAHELLAKIG